MSEKKNFFETMASQGKSYVDGRVTEVKLKVVKALSRSMSYVAGMLIFILLAAVGFGLLALALTQWLNGLLGSPFGTLAVAGFFVALALIAFLLRKKLFRSGFVSMFAGILMDEECGISSYSDLMKAERENQDSLKACSDMTRDAFRDIRHRLSPLKLLSELLEKSNDVIDNAGVVFKSARNLIRNITGRGYRYEEPENDAEDVENQNEEQVNNI